MEAMDVFVQGPQSRITILEAAMIKHHAEIEKQHAQIATLEKDKKEVIRDCSVCTIVSMVVTRSVDRNQAPLA